MAFSRASRVFAIAAAALAVPATAGWSVISQQLGQFLTGVTFSTPSTGCLAIGGPGGIGYFTQQSVDGGKTWTITPNGDAVIPELYETAVAGSRGVVVSDILNEYTTNAGSFWNDSLSFGAAGGGRPRALPDATFAITSADFNDNTNGIALSPDGISWVTHDAGFTDTGANFGTFNGSNFFVTGETNPQALIAPPSPLEGVTRVRSLSPLRQVWTYANGTRRGRWAAREAHRATASDAAARRAQTSGYITEIRASIDTGVTWTSLFRSEGYFYLSGIDASPDAHTVCTLANAPADTPTPGAAIYCSFDRGVSWATTFNTTDAATELVDIRFVSATEAWAVGGTYDGTNAVAIWWHTTDSGHTWTNASSLPAYFATSINCLSPTQCWSAVIDPNTDSSWVAYGP